MTHSTQLWAPRIFTLKGYVKENILGGVKALDIGCGGKKLPGADGIDSLRLIGVDIVHDLDVFPWPITDNAYDLVFANHFLEHAKDVVGVMEEIYRILKPGGACVIQVPYFRSVDAFTDPTHESFFTARSLDYFIEGRSLFKYAYSKSVFKGLGFWYGWPHPSSNFFKKILKNYIYKHSNFYDQYLSLFIPTECLTWELEVKK